MYDVKELKRLLGLEENRVVSDSGRILPPSNPVFQKLSKAMADFGSPMTAKHIYTSVQQNRHEFFAHVLEIFVPDLQKEEDCFRISDENGGDESFDFCSEQTQCGVTQKFKVVLSSEKWVTIKPSPKRSGTLNLKIGLWTDLIAEKIYEQHGIPCAFSFKRAKVRSNNNAKYYIKFSGKCKECGGNLVGVALRKPGKNQDIIFECMLTNFVPNVFHIKRRQLRGARRQKVAADLVDNRKNAALWLNEHAQDNIRFGDNVPPYFPTAAVLRKAKQEMIDQRLDLPSKDPIHNLRVAMNGTYEGIIHSLGSEPFFCIYFLPEQLLLHQVFYENNKDVYDTVDATGGIAFRIPFRHEDGAVQKNSKYIFLYQYMCVNNKEFEKNGRKSCPVFQLVSERHDASFLKFFFSEIIRLRGTRPRLVITDFGKALLIGLANSFAGCYDLKAYLSVCYDLIVLNRHVSLPLCCLKLDVNHFMAMLARWKCLKGKNSGVRQLYLRTLCHVYLMTNFDDIENTLLSLIIVALSEHIGTDEDGKSYPSSMYLEAIDKVIRGIPNIIDPLEAQSENDDNDSHQVESILDSQDCADDNLRSWAESLKEKAQGIAQKCKNESLLSLNPYYSEKVAKAINDLIVYFPLWTCVMYPKLGLDLSMRSSSAVEGQFSKMKKDGFERLPLRVDKFVLKHIEWLKGEVNLLAPAMLGRDRTTLTRKIEDYDIFQDSLNEVENWRGKTKRAKQAANDKDDFPFIAGISDEGQISEPNSINIRPVTRADAFIHPDLNAINYIANGSSNRISGRMEEKTIVDSDKSPCKNKIFSSTVLSVSDAKDTSDIFPVSPIPHQDNTPETEFGNFNSKIDSETLNSAILPEKSRVIRNNYLSDQPNWNSTRHVPNVTFPFIPNGMCSPQLKINGIRYLVTHTCAFDTLTTLLMHASSLEDQFKEEMTKANLPITILVLEILNSVKLTKTHFKKRFDILQALNFLKKTVTTEKLLGLNAECNIGHLFETLFKTFPSTLKTCICSECNVFTIRKFPCVAIDTHVLFDKGYGSMQSAIDNVLKSDHFT